MKTPSHQESSDPPDIKSNTNVVVNQLRSAGILKVSEETEAMVSKLMADNSPKATTRRVLKPRTKKSMQLFETGPGEHEVCLDCGAPLIPCICRKDCPGGMCSRTNCEWNLKSNDNTT